VREIDLKSSKEEGKKMDMLERKKGIIKKNVQK
jgi:hypothetical protein